MKFNLIDGPNFRVFHFAVEGGVITPEQFQEFLEGLPALVLPGDKGVVISGRGPVWVFVALAEKFHPCKWVASLDPRIGAVVCGCHSPERRIGEVIPLEEIRQMAPDLGI